MKADRQNARLLLPLAAATTIFALVALGIAAGLWVALAVAGWLVLIAAVLLATLALAVAAKREDEWAEQQRNNPGP